MKEKLFIFGALIVMVAILAGLNAASYTQKEEKPDNEMVPNRSTFNSGATGTQAYYTLLSETGRNVIRWQEPPAALLSARKKPAVFIITGDIKRGFTDPDAERLLRWVSEGGRLVLIDREPPEQLAVTTAAWKIVYDTDVVFKYLGADPSDQQQMTADTAAVKPVQPSVFAASVNAIQPSKLASSILLERMTERQTSERPLSVEQSPTVTGPIVHFGNKSKNYVVGLPFGSGSIVLVSDPYLVSNAGIAIADNAQLGINLATAGSAGLIAFDEYHQGYGNDSNRFLQFFAGTPVVAIFLQAVILVGLVFLSQSRRFARPVPEPEPDRLSKLEYVSAMSELQRRAKAYDLAIENIYTEFRRRAARLLGIDVHAATSRELATRISDRTGLDRAQLEACFFKCEEIIRGERTNRREVVKLAEELRGFEQKLGLSRSARAIG